MTNTIKAKVLVLGGGPGGYVAAIRAGQLGLDTVLVEANRLGGTCLIRGCMPSKAIIHVAGEFEAMMKTAAQCRHGIALGMRPDVNFAEPVKWKDEIVDKLSSGVAALLKRAKVRVLKGWGTFTDAKTCHVKTDEGDIIVHAEHVVLATGSRPAELPFLPFTDNVVSSTKALCFDAVPKRLVLVGAGYIGLELGIAFRKLGSELIIVETKDRILLLYDAQLVEPVRIMA